MPKDIATRLKDYFPSFSKGQKKIAKAILEEYDKCAYMTASKLGRYVGVSESTVVRFAYSLGFDGYFQDRSSATSVFTPDFQEKTF